MDAPDVSEATSEEPTEQEMAETANRGDKTEGGLPKSESKARHPLRPIHSSDSVVVNQAELLVFCVLLYAAAGLAAATYLYINETEEDDFENMFADAAREIVVATDSKINQAVAMVASVSSHVTSYAKETNKTFPFVTVPDFAIMVREVRELAGSRFIGWDPVVHKEDSKEWENYASNNLWWLEEQSVDRESIQNVDVSFDSNVNAEFHVPSWQVTPIEGSLDNLNDDLMELSWFRRLASEVFVERKPLVSGNVVLPSRWGEGERGNLVLSPVYESFEGNSTVVGFISSQTSWEAILSDVLRIGTRRLLVETYDSCGTVSTYAVDGTVATFLGEGYLHDLTLEKHRVSVEVLTSYSTPATCIHTINIYPTKEFESEYKTNSGQIYAVVVLVVFFLTTLIFVFYSCLVRRRHQKIVSQIKERSEAVVNALFPKNVQDRLLEGAATAQGSRAVRVELQSLFGDQTCSSTETLHDGKPIADLFTETTVMFADIKGFTAWSSTREPPQVFMLLEIIYQAFDDIARRRRIFKVETVGDCYVAVAGLPEARKDHAYAMALFASDCLRKFNQITKKLEVALGPGTGDLDLRVGLHSGPVTAGVLRGERPRFQLFGDTMNTTARIETNGEGNRIHLSQQTAQQLIQLGKEHWVTPRQDKVFAKGKGELQTYWLEISGRGCASVTSGSTYDGSSTCEDKEHLSFVDGIEEPHLLSAKYHRLVDWNTDILAAKLKQIVAMRVASGVKSDQPEKLRRAETMLMETKAAPLEELKDIIEVPDYRKAREHMASVQVELDQKVLLQLRNYVSSVASLYRDNYFHNFEHASHVVMSVTKLFSRIIAPDIAHDGACAIEATIHDHTYGISSDPLTQFAAHLAALIHDVDHPGVPNAQLVKEEDPSAATYKNRSVAEQNSIDIGWGLLMQENFVELRNTIYGTEEEFYRFRELLVNNVMATDIMDKELGALRKGRWEKAFKQHPDTENSDEIESNASLPDIERLNRNRKATIVIEHVIQASDVAHTMQHWHVYKKWNERLFKEMYKAYLEGRAEKNPAENWYTNEIGFLDYYVIPLAKKLKDCGVFGVSSDECLNYAETNRFEWETKGKQLVSEMIESMKTENRN